MITCNLMGGLGNQLFQIFSTIAYAIKSRNQFKFLGAETLGGDGCTLRYTFWKTLLSNLKPFLIPNIPPCHTIREKGFHYNELSIIEMVNRDILIFGYFQSYKYFDTHYSTIYKVIGIEQKKQDLLNKLQTTSDDFDNTISMHFRIGDYINIQHVHPIATYNYYESALSYISTNNPTKEYNIFFFCEDTDIGYVLNTINHLAVKFPSYKFIRGDNTLADWEQMLLMSFCHHNIIANSSFSWWGAYFNSHPDKIVCYPSVWFGPTIKNDTKDLCPPKWVKISV